jgi:hypothetical protein
MMHISLQILIKGGNKMNVNFKIFRVGDDYSEYIVAESAEQALNNYNERADDDCKVTIEEVSEVPFDAVGRFETDDGFKEMTFGEFLNYGEPFIYKGPQVICWSE